jgi:hypothetical protein
VVAARRIQSASLFLIFLSLTLALVTGCVNSGSASPDVDFLDDGSEGSGDRRDCGEVYGTAFRSDSERDWFKENCSRWPLVNVPEYKPTQNANANQPRECNEIRGRPYESSEQRRWYLENCMGGNNDNNSGQGGSDNGNSGNSDNNAQQQAGDRRNCDEIRGTPYRSNSERSWYTANCSGNQQQQPSSGPDRTNCNEIRGTPYRSNAERNWFLRNCGQATTNSNPPGTTQTQLVIPGGNRGRGGDD